jgi:hypothetical protein
MTIIIIVSWDLTSMKIFSIIKSNRWVIYSFMLYIMEWLRHRRTWYYTFNYVFSLISVVSFLLLLETYECMAIRNMHEYTFLVSSTTF